MSLVLCFAMLLGTTFAWFTDNASTAVNKIQAGTLDVALEMKDASGNWVNAEGQTLSWVKARTHLLMRRFSGSRAAPISCLSCAL